MLFFKSLQDVN